MKNLEAAPKAVIKFLNDGKKVVVVGKLNNAEYIVQEIFCTESGGEIPSGDQFVVRSVHDKPLQSYAEKTIVKNKATLAKLQGEIDTAYSNTRKIQRIAAAKIRSLSAIAKEATVDSLDELEMFVAGEIKYLLRISWRGCQIGPLDGMLAENDSFRDYGIKLLSLFGEADGTLQWRIHQYSDHSGGSDQVCFATSLQDATAKAQSLYDERVKTWRNGGKEPPPSLDWLRGGGGNLDIPSDVKNWYAAKSENSRKERIGKLEAELRKLRKEQEVDDG